MVTLDVSGCNVRPRSAHKGREDPMLKVALLAAVLFAAASLATAESSYFEPAAAASAAGACHPEQSPATDCAVRALDTDGDGSISAAELANLAAPAADLAPLSPIQA